MCATKHCLGLTLVLLLQASAAEHPTAIVQKKANLRHDPSADKPAILILLPDQEVEVLDTKKSPRYAKVRTDHPKKTGWVLKSAISILPEEPPAVVTPPPDNPDNMVTAPSPGTAPAATISPDWTKQKPVTVAYNGTEGTCQPGGSSGGDTPTNLLKNRSDDLPQAHDVIWSAIASLAFPAAPAHRSDWTKQQLAQIAPFEGVAVRTVGYLAHKAKVEDAGTGESCNCKFVDPDDVDWHIYLAQKPTDTAIAKSVVVETTPRIRQQRHWDFTVLERFVGKGPVRISGFLLLDPEHRSQVGTARITVWEIHPVTKIEVCEKATCAANEWKDLDGLH
jgi:hypothetical protein